MSAIAKFRVTGPDSTLVVQIPAAVLIRSFRITDQGPPGPPGPSGSLAMVLDEIPVGVINGINVNFATAANFAQLSVFLNGLRLRGGGIDYIVTGTDLFAMIEAPLLGDSLTVEYTT